MGNLSQILPYLQKMFGGGAASMNGMQGPQPASPTMPPMGMLPPPPPNGGITPQTVFQGTSDPMAMGTPPMAGPMGGIGMANPNAGPAIANLTGAEAGPTAMGPSNMNPAPAAGGNPNLAKYAAVMRALGPMVSGSGQQPERPMAHVGSTGIRGGSGATAIPGPQGRSMPNSVGSSLATSQGQQLIARLRAMMQPQGMSLTGA